MKKIYICAALGLFFASCSTEESATTHTEDMKTVNVVTKVNWVEAMNDIEKACESNTSYANTADLIEKVRKIAYSNAKFNAIAGSNYVEPTADELIYVMSTNALTTIQSMNYSIVAKTYLEDLLVNQETWTVDPTKDSGLSFAEIDLLTTLHDIVDPDDEWNKKKPIAIAYGYQQSLAKAVMMSVLAQEFKKIDVN